MPRRRNALGVHEHDQVEFEALGQLRASASGRAVGASDVRSADDAGGPLGVLGEPRLEDRARSARSPCRTGTPVLRMEVGTFASGSTSRITGSASAITSAGVR